MGLGGDQLDRLSGGGGGLFLLLSSLPFTAAFFCASEPELDATTMLRSLLPPTPILLSPAPLYALCFSQKKAALWMHLMLPHTQPPLACLSHPTDSAPAFSEFLLWWLHLD